MSISTPNIFFVLFLSCSFLSGVENSYAQESPRNSPGADIEGEMDEDLNSSDREFVESAGRPLSYARNIRRKSTLPNAPSDGLISDKVRLRGRVTCIPKGGKGFYFQDGTGGLYCEPSDSQAETQTQRLKVGEAVEVGGVVQSVNYRPYIVVTEVQNITTDFNVEPSQLRLTEITEVHEALLLSVSGYVKFASLVAGELSYTISSQGVDLEVVHQGFWTEVNHDLMHASVEAKGVFVPHFDNEISEVSSIGKLIVQSQKNFRLLKESEEIEQEAESVRIVDLIKSSPKDHNNLIRVEGDVTLVEKDSFWLVRNEGAIKIQNYPDTSQLTNRTIEAIGMVTQRNGKIGLESVHVLVERLTSNSPLQGRTVSSIDASIPLGTVVETEGSFLHLLQLGNAPLLVFETSSGELHAKLPPETKRKTFDQFNPEARFRIRGILDRESGSAVDSSVPIILVRGTNDVVQLTKGGWSKKALWALVIILAITLVGITFTAITSQIQLQHVEGALRNLEEKAHHEKNDLQDAEKIG